MDYCNRFKLKEELTDILNENNITNRIIVTRWTSLEEAFKRLDDLKLLPTKYDADFVIVKAVTKAIRLIESDSAGIDVYDKTMTELHNSLKPLNVTGTIHKYECINNSL
jgi:hypothetical protein